MRILLLLLAFNLFSCAGYRFQERDNPFRQYGIKKISIPMFYNQSSLSNITPAFTKEIYNMLTSFNDLRVVESNSDATIIGIIQSEQRVFDTVTPSAPRNVENIADEEIGKTRGEFYIPSSSNVNLVLKIIVIQKPTKEEIKFLRSKASDKNFLSSKIIFRESINLSHSFTREVFEGRAVSVNHTQNAGALKRSIRTMSQNAAQTFREMILYAF